MSLIAENSSASKRPFSETSPASASPTQQPTAPSDNEDPHPPPPKRLRRARRQRETSHTDSRRERKPRREKSPLPCQHTCEISDPNHVSSPLDTRGSSWDRHMENVNLHPLCNDSCPGFRSFCKGKKRLGSSSSTSVSTPGPSIQPSPITSLCTLSPLRPIRVLHVLHTNYSCPFGSDEDIQLETTAMYEYGDDADGKEFEGYLKRVTESTRSAVISSGSAYLHEWILVFAVYGAKEPDLFSFDLQTRRGFFNAMEKARKANRFDHWLYDLANTYDIIFLDAAATAKDSFETYIKNLALLEKVQERIPIWPAIEEQRLEGNKFKVIQTLDLIAKSLSSSLPRHSWRPSTYDMPQAQRLQQAGQFESTQYVAKRSCSGCARHVKFKFDLPTLAASDKGDKLHPISYWFVQQFVPTLRSCGEYRVYLVRGSIISIIWTKFRENSDILDIRLLQHPKPLKMFDETCVYILYLPIY
jgi:hypothetical protein